MRRCAVLVLLVGCFFEPARPHAVARDGGTDGSAACSFGPWSVPHAITTANTTAVEDNADLSPDGKHLVFVRGTASSMLWMVDWDGSSFGAAQQLTMLGSDVDAPSWAPDGSRLYFIVGGAENKVATFDGSSFAAPTQTNDFVGLMPPSEGGYSFNAAGTDVYYSYSGSSNASHVFHATGKLGVSWNASAQLTALTGDCYEPAIRRDGLELVYSVAPASGNSELFSARVSGNTVTNIHATENQVDGERPTLSGDGTMLVYNGADFELYYATRTCQ